MAVLFTICTCFEVIQDADDKNPEAICIVCLQKFLTLVIYQET